MKRFLLSLFCLPLLVGIACAGELSLPPLAQGKAGQPIPVTATADSGRVRWLSPDGKLNVVQAEGDGRTCLVTARRPGTYRLVAWSLDSRGLPDQLASMEVKACVGEQEITVFPRDETSLDPFSEANIRKSPRRSPSSESRLRSKLAPSPKEDTPTFDEAYRQAARAGRPLCVWVGYYCGSSAKRLKEMDHWAAPGDVWHGSKTTMKGAGAVILVPKGDGSLYYFPDLGVHADECCATTLRDALEKTQARLGTQEVSAVADNVRGFERRGFGASASAPRRTVTAPPARQSSFGFAPAALPSFG